MSSATTSPLGLTSASHHLDVVAAVHDLVAALGPAATLAELRAQRPALRAGSYNDTVAVFLVWAVARLRDGGLARTAVLWHPLVQPGSAECWWPAEVLDSDAARERAIAPTDLRAGEPMPCEPPQRRAA